MQRIWIVLAISMLVGCGDAFKTQDKPAQDRPGQEVSAQDDSRWVRFQADYPKIAKAYTFQRTMLTKYERECRLGPVEPPPGCDLAAQFRVGGFAVLENCLGPCERVFHDCAAQGWVLEEGDLVRQCKEEYDLCKAKETTP